LARNPYQQAPAHDPVIQGFGARDGRPVRQGTPRLLRTILPDKRTAITSWQAIAAALARERTGEASMSVCRCQRSSLFCGRPT
jgi:crotonobetainyl-CoA:carnitine CoA-transferase CaiB-like acyl-CoA transferase